MQAVIALYQDVKSDQLERIKSLAKDYQVKNPGDIDLADDPRIEIIYGWDASLTEDRLRQMTQLKWIQKDSAGLDAIPDWLKNDGSYFVTSLSGIHGQAITETVLAYVLSVYRGLDQARTLQRKRVWQGLDHSVYRSLNDKTILIYGTGHIGSRLAEVFKVFGSRVLGVNTSGRPVDIFDDTFVLTKEMTLLDQVDILINALPLTKDTDMYFSRKIFEAMNQNSLFINIGRGGSLDQEALYQALVNNDIGGAYLDVFEPEPLPDTSPLWDIDELLITPHMSGQVEHFRDQAFDIFFPNLQVYLKKGQPEINIYQAGRGY